MHFVSYYSPWFVPGQAFLHYTYIILASSCNISLLASSIGYHKCRRCPKKSCSKKTDCPLRSYNKVVHNEWNNICLLVLGTAEDYMPILNCTEDVWRDGQQRRWMVCVRASGSRHYHHQASHLTSFFMRFVNLCQLSEQDTDRRKHTKIKALENNVLYLLTIINSASLSIGTW